MSTLRVTNLQGGSAGSAPNLPDGAVITGVATVGVLSATTFYGSGANLTGIDATALKDGGGTVKVQANSDGAVVTGVLTAPTVSGTTGSFTGNVSVGGTLTYEDVTNIDSVGLITARTGVKVTTGGIEVAAGGANITGNIGLGGANYGTSGQLLTSGGSGANASWTTVSTSPQVEMTAAEALTAEDALQVSSNGTAEKVAGFNAAFGAEIDGAAPSDGSIRARETCAFGYDESKDVYVMMYQNQDQSDHVYAIVMTPDANAADKMIMGAPCLILNEYITSTVTRNKILLEYNPDKQGLFYAFHRGQAGGRMRYGMLSISGTGANATVSSAYDNDTSSSQNDYGPGGAAYNTTDNTMAMTMTYYGQGSPYEPHTTMITYPTANSISQSGLNEADGSYGYQTDLAYNSVDNCYLLVFRENTNFCQGRVMLNNGSNNGFTYPAAKDYVEGNYTKSNTGMRIAYDPNTNKFLGVWIKNGDSKLYCKWITANAAGAIATGSEILVDNGSFGLWCDFEVVYNTVAKRFVIAYNFNGTNGTELRTVQIVGSAGQASDITVGIAQVAQSDRLPQFTALGTRQDSGACLVGFNNASTSDKNFGAKVFDIPYTNLDTSVFLGFAKETVAQGATVAVKISGNTSTRVGLSSGSAYYVQSDGSVGLTPVTGNSVKAGVALNSTTLLIKQT